MPLGVLDYEYPSSLYGLDKYPSVARKATEHSLIDGASINKSILFLFFILKVLITWSSVRARRVCYENSYD